MNININENTTRFFTSHACLHLIYILSNGALLSGWLQYGMTVTQRVMTIIQRATAVIYCTMVLIIYSSRTMCTMCLFRVLPSLTTIIYGQLKLVGYIHNI